MDSNKLSEAPAQPEAGSTSASDSQIPNKTNVQNTNGELKQGKTYAQTVKITILKNTGSGKVGSV